MDSMSWKMMLQTHEEQEPFLTADEGIPEASKGSKIKPHPKRTHLFSLNGVFGLFNLLFLILNFALLLRTSKTLMNEVHLDNRFNESDLKRTFSPAQSAIEYKVELLGYGSSPFVGEPRYELDQAWSNLLRATMVKVSEDEMRMMNKTSIQMKDGSGYLGYLEAHHMLHCVKRIYQFRHQGAYPELKGGDTFSSMHIDHCLEVLREGIMCNADISMNTFFWKDPRTIKGDRSGARKCTNWDRIQDWADNRRVQYADMDEFIDALVPAPSLMSVYLIGAS
ncbi:hypothetical protein F4808DRAFT_454100 [Astrocystis sublimbata]|nr:hypothetical protein F4808DRAFT_454100 [Astrocystis sublimbata]